MQMFLQNAIILNNEIHLLVFNDFHMDYEISNFAFAMNTEHLTAHNVNFIWKILTEKKLALTQRLLIITIPQTTKEYSIH